MKELSTTGLYIYMQEKLAEVDQDWRYRDFVRLHASMEGVTQVLINAYTGGIIED